MNLRHTAILLSVVSATCAAGANAWPVVSPASGVIHFSEVTGRHFEKTLVGKNGKTLYSLTCKSGDLEDDDFNYSGLFHCRLVSLTTKEQVPSLLLEDSHATSDWEGRARFLLNNVVGNCGQYPDWGASRTFLLRGMRLTLGVSDVSLTPGNQPGVKAFDFTYAVTPAVMAKGALAAPSKYAEPAWFARSDKCTSAINHSRHGSVCTLVLPRWGQNGGNR